MNKFIKDLIGKSDIHGKIITKKRALKLYNDLRQTTKKLNILGVWNKDKDIKKRLKNGEEVILWKANN